MCVRDWKGKWVVKRMWGSEGIIKGFFLLETVFFSDS